MNQNNENLQDTAAAYVLGALPELEMQAFRREMMRDCELGRYVESLESVGDVMLAAVPAIEVPDSLGASIMAEARRDQEVAELITSPRAGQEAPAKPRGRLAGWLLRPAVGVAAAAVLIVGAFAIGQSVGGSNNAPTAPTVAAVPFQPVGGSNASGKVVPIANGSKGAVVKVSGLDPNIGSDVYELWIQRGKQISSSTVFTVRSDGTGVSAMPQDMTGVNAVMITREPAGGSTKPTSKPLAIAKI
jgi:anti-sigma-K factor RskA